MSRAAQWAASAAALAREGAKVAIAARTQETLTRAAQTIGAAPIVADLSGPDGVQACIEQTRQTIGNPDILVINTGGPSPATFAQTTPEGWRDATDQLFHFTIEMLMAFLCSERATYITGQAIACDGGVLKGI